MKIIYCINGTFNSGGMERVLANKANYLANIGYDITIITTDQQNREPYFELSSKISHIDLGINYTSVQGMIGKIISYPLNQLKHKKKLTNIINELKPDVVISMFDHDASFLYKIKDGSKKVVEIHFSKFKRLQYGRTGIWKLIDVLRSKNDVNLVKNYDAFVVLTNEDKAYWGDLENMLVIPNANSFESSKNALLVNRKAIAVGRLSDQKDYDSMIEIWSLIASKFPDWVLEIYGHGELYDQLKNKIAKLGLVDKIIIQKPVSNIKDKYLEASLHIMTSKYEGLPMAMLEAQACGLPLISYDCKCGPKDVIVEGKNGFVIPMGDKDAFAAKLSEILSNEMLRNAMGEISKSRSSLFSENRIMRMWIDLFEKLK